ncbi:hypothetical protein COF61_22465 [Bacillus toyonensis]|nr:hypothetical protein COF61_22465 [Bacillus toyonensis]
MKQRYLTSQHHTKRAFYISSALKFSNRNAPYVVLVFTMFNKYMLGLIYIFVMTLCIPLKIFLPIYPLFLVPSQIFLTVKILD